MKINYDFHVVAIGASAGGLKAITEFFSSVKDLETVAFVVAVHFKRDAQTHLAGILSRITTMEVLDISERMKIEPGKVYVHPPSKLVSVIAGRFRLKERPASNVINHTIDYLFSSLAKDVGNKLIAIVMSGTGSDGTEGFKVVEEHNGTTIVQHPETADFDGMPMSSIKYDDPSHIASPSKMPGIIANLVHGTEVK